MYRILCTFLTTVCLSVVAIPASGSDLAKEKRWADQVVDDLLDGEAVYLNDGKNDFLSIYTPSDSESEHGMIVVHGTGVHPNWDQIIQPVRVEMTTRGWNTLSIQMPILVNEATYEDYIPLYPEVPARLKAAEKYLTDQGMKKIVVVAHSRGTSMSAYYLSGTKHGVASFVAIGMGATQADEEINSAKALEKITIPTLDIYGTEDLESVLETVEKRSAAAQHNKGYEQHVVDGANHFFDDHSEALVNTVAKWLNAQ